VDKSLTLEVAARLGVAVPRGGYVSSPAEVPGVLEVVGLPAVVKPVESWADAGPVPVRLRCLEVVRAEEAVAATGRICAAGGRCYRNGRPGPVPVDRRDQALRGRRPRRLPGGPADGRWTTARPAWRTPVPRREGPHAHDLVPFGGSRDR
jgi:hypothetical protein